MRVFFIIFLVLISISAKAADCSKAIVTGGRAVTLFTTGQATNGFVVQNIEQGEALWVSFIGPAVQASTGSFVLSPAQPGAFSSSAMFTMAVPAGSVTMGLSAVAGTAGHKISCYYW